MEGPGSQSKTACALTMAWKSGGRRLGSRNAYELLVPVALGVGGR